MKQTRRHFLKTSLAVAAPLVVPCTVFGDATKAAANERIGIGHIGAGNQGGHLFRSSRGVREMQSIAVADCFKSRREATAAAIKGQAYLDFRELLARDDIDGVIIAVPDHWHVPIAVAAARAKKSVYVEKPLGLTLEQNLICQKVFAETSQVFQYGTQQRSQENCWRGCELVRQGVIGKIKAIEVDAPNGGKGGSTAEAPIPDDLGREGFEMWTGPAPLRPYTPDRCKPNGTYWIYDYSIGYLGGWGAHPLDIMVWGCDADLSGPVVVEGTGVVPTEGLYDVVYDWDMKIKLGAVDVTFKPGSDRTRFIGENGWIEVRRNGTTASHSEWLQKPLDEEKSILKRSRHHIGDFVLSIRDKKEPVSTLRDAARSDNISQLCDIAARTKQVVRWDPQKMELIDPTPEQRKYASRPMRTPWTL